MKEVLSMQNVITIVMHLTGILQIVKKGNMIFQKNLN